LADTRNECHENGLGQKNLYSGRLVYVCPCNSVSHTRRNNVFTYLNLIVLWLSSSSSSSSSSLPVYEFSSLLFSTYKEVLDDEVGRERKEAIIIYFELVTTFDRRNLETLRNSHLEYMTVEVSQYLISV
jgi:hypothetical protein